MINEKQEEANEGPFDILCIPKAPLAILIVVSFISLLLLSCSGIHQSIFVPSEIEGYCSRISVGAGDGQSMRTCVSQEKNAKGQLSRMTVPADISRYCRRLADTTGGSYQVMLTCVRNELSDL